MTHARPATHGVALVLAAAALWGTTGTAQSLAPPQLASVWVGTLRLVVAALFFAGWLALRRPAMPRHGLPWRGIVLAGLCMGAYNLAFFAGVRAAGVAVGTAVALGSGPLWAGLLEATLARRRLRPLWWTGTALAVAGGMVMVAGNAAGPVSAAGLLLCLTAGLAYAAYALLNKSLVTRAPPSVVTGAVFATAALLALAPAWGWAGTPTLGGTDLAVVVWLGVASTGVAYLLFSHGLRHVSGATAVALALFEPVTAFALAVVVVGERPGVWALAGLVAVLAGLAVVVRSELAGRSPT